MSRAAGEAEKRVTTVFIDWLVRDGWTAREGDPRTEADVVAVRGKESLFAEVKSDTRDMGTDVDIAFGQLLRRMPERDDASVRYAVVVPAARVDKVDRV